MNARWSGHAFGLVLEATFPVVGTSLQPDVGGSRRTRVSAATLNGSWPGHEAVRLAERRTFDGRLGMAVDSHQELGYRVDAPGHGRFLVSTDGTSIGCDLPPGPAWRWHRPFFSQALPLAATLQGLELLHASAVAIDGRAIAFVGRSGAGKTSLAIHLVAGGAQLLTDDVLALEAGRDHLMAHPGVQMANVADEELRSLPGSARAALGTPIGSSDKMHLAVETATTPVRLAALYFLRRDPRVDALSFEPLRPADPRLILGATFMPHVTTPARLRTQLETCAQATESVANFALSVPAGFGAARLAEAVERHQASLD